ncbi:ferredoxin [Pilimelia anulata]|uniref:Ferredoxin n=1 Tax=Pilimelia anulata TaxID=53371 RepID=A0A8J3BGZ2_9ACTN|nr:ferredoxin [Pilimelia anulata]GGK07177.1 ferredoxin [Pilimelia anulata]
MRVVVDRDRCVGAGQCVLAEPRVFDQDDLDGTVVLRAERPPADALPAVRMAVDLCPGRALALDEG